MGSLFGNQNNFAAFLSLSLPYFAVLPIVFRDVRLKAIGFAGGAVALMFILLAGSKSGLLSAGFVVIGLLVLVGSDRRARGRLVVAGGIAVMAVALVVPILQGAGPVKLDERTVTKLDFNVLRSQIETQSGSGGVRNALLTDGLNIIAETNGLGVGAGNAESAGAGAGRLRPRVANLHNWWLEVLVDGGIVGLALYLLFFLTLLRGQARASRRTQDPFVRYMCLAGALSLIGWIIGSVGPSTAIHFAPMWIMFGLGMGALVPRAPGGAAIRILMLSHMYPSAVNPTGGIFVHEQARALVELGHDVRVVSPKAWAPPLLTRWRAYREVPGVNVIDGIPVLYPRKLTLPGGPPGPPQQRRDAAGDRALAAAHPRALALRRDPRPDGGARRLGRGPDGQRAGRARGGDRAPRGRAGRPGPGTAQPRAGDRGHRGHRLDLLGEPGDRATPRWRWRPRGGRSGSSPTAPTRGSSSTGRRRRRGPTWASPTTARS